MKVLKLSVEFEGRYATKEGHVLMPVDSNGVIFGYLQENRLIEKSVDLGELEGKHSECYGDLKVETIDLTQLSPLEAQMLVENSDFGTFEIFFEHIESDFKEYVQELKEEEYEEIYEIEAEENQLYDNLGIVKPDYGIKSHIVYKSFMKQLEEFMKDKKTAEITVLASDLTKAQALLLDNGIKLF